MKSSVLCYNLKGTKKGKQIAMIFGFLGYKVRHVEKEEYHVPIGVLAGADKMEGERPVFEGEGFSDEMLVMNAESEEMMDKALFLMRKEGVKVGLKAMLTPSNREWTSTALHDEIQKEHEYMKEMERNKKD
ncbi:DUF3783 domain-containing protein [Extibacter muris]|uniref:DUF3783 domain-containing protein n=1 Tax=Extibacter muris TaxID=1796622 RepID=UPI001D060DA0|nr:DUF3783 domain-containing protein [Extibacter muris]MCB6200990.1 DUF3783 domain-containing protein [Extibacter muris]MCQ4662320.1 DUF3783 domain-containing protein [Extibacter muris]MCQ4691753.1 DUF3783 domain-containing protein [Extibacter muris]